MYSKLTEGEYEIDLETSYNPGEMLIGASTIKGTSERTFVFNANTCHPHMANDGFSASAILIRFFQWLRKQPQSYYTYELIFAPEHVGSVFYLADKSEQQLRNYVGGLFAEMLGNKGPIKLASSFRGESLIERALANSLQHYSNGYELIPWRTSAGNDETVWEAPGYEVPMPQANRSVDRFMFREYHSSLDNPDMINFDLIEEFYHVLQKTYYILENNCIMTRKFKGIVCLSAPEYQLYHERIDPAVEKRLPLDSEKWGYLNDCILRYFDSRKSVLDVAEQHDLPFDQLHKYICEYEKKDLIDMTFLPEERVFDDDWN